LRSNEVSEDAYFALRVTGEKVAAQGNESLDRLHVAAATKAFGHWLVAYPAPIAHLTLPAQVTRRQPRL